jgi:hypothetical protein
MEGSPVGAEKKTAGMIAAFDALWEQTRPAFAQERTWRRARTLALSALVGLGRRTVTGMLSASAQQGADWSATYRLFERERFDTGALFAPARRGVCSHLGENDPLVVLLDDTLVRKRGRRVHGAAWKRDPLGPPFCNNFVWGQRFLQLSAALPEGNGPRRARGIPIDLAHCPLPKKPRKKAPLAEWEGYWRLQKTMKVSAVGAARLKELRAQVDADPGGEKRPLIVAVDGTFTNKTVFRNLPQNTVVVGRIRKDSRLFLPPPPSGGPPRRGRRRWYGEALPTPEQIRQDSTLPWITVPAWGSGQVHRFEVKTLAPVRWLGSGDRDVRLVAIRPLAYRPRKGAPLHYRNPVYLVCTDPQLPLGQLLQSFLWRWEIEQNFRDEKTVLGMGEAQVRTKAAVETVPCFVVAAYAFLLLAAAKAGQGRIGLPPPKWRRMTSAQRESTPRLLGALRSQLWGKALGVNLTHFVKNTEGKTIDVKIADALPSAVCYAFR